MDLDSGSQRNFKTEKQGNEVDERRCVICHTKEVLLENLESELPARRLQDKYVFRVCQSHEEEVLQKKATDITNFFNDIADGSARYFTGFAVKDGIPSGEFITFPGNTTIPPLLRCSAIYILRHASPTHERDEGNVEMHREIQLTQLEAVLAQMRVAREAIGKAGAMLEKSGDCEMMEMVVGKGAGVKRASSKEELLSKSVEVLHKTAKDILALYGRQKGGCSGSQPCRSEVYRAAIDHAREGDGKGIAVQQQAIEGHLDRLLRSA